MSNRNLGRFGDRPPQNKKRKRTNDSRDYSDERTKHDSNNEQRDHHNNNDYRYNTQQRRKRRWDNQSDNRNEKMNKNIRGSRPDLSTDRNPKFSDSGQKEKLIGFRHIEVLLTKDTEQAIMELHKNYDGFVATLNKEDLSENLIVLIVRLLDKICDATFTAVQSKLLQAGFNGMFRKKLLHYLNLLPLQDEYDKHKNKYFWNNKEEFWQSLLKVFRFIVDTSPSYACGVLVKLTKSVVQMMSIEQNTSICASDEIKTSFKDVYEKLELFIKDYERKKIKFGVKQNDQEQEPPNDFRDISIYPNPQELTDPRPNFLRKNVIKGPYKDVQDYLDIQFRLLREDFVAPLREAICSFSSENKNRLQNVKIYRNVNFLKTEFVNNQNCYKISFGSPRKGFFKYQESKRFMFGALLCFTQDNFNTIIFGKVVDRHETLLMAGCLIVGFDTNQQVNIDFKMPYMMVECNVYFEPYFHVLSVLKNFDIISFPMEKYIILVDNTPRHPKYLSPTTTYTINQFSFNPLDWPEDHQFLNLNKSQSEAYKAALTQEFAVIQGPPGTGKTFLGLTIARTLLLNKDTWYTQTPMLVICYTNHALDQFLEGLINVTPRILRVGGQSKNEKLNKFNLRQRIFKENSAVGSARWRLKSCLSEIKEIDEYIAEIDKFDSILNLKCFESVAPEIPWLTKLNSSDQCRWLFKCPGYHRISRRAEIESIQLRNDDGGMETKKDYDIEDDNAQIDDDFDADIFKDIHYDALSILVDVKKLDRDHKNLETKLMDLQGNYDEWENNQIIADLNECSRIKHVLQEMLKLGREQTFHKIDNFKNYTGDWNCLTFASRWNLYLSLLFKYKEHLQKRHEQLKLQFQQLYREYEEIRDIDHVNIMKNMLVVGMTTTGAARLHSSLQALKSPVVIVEEAAEVLEAHIVTSLTSHCQHLILIGDHQQLKPSTAHFKIETKFHLGVSLFERMVHNDIQCYTLDVQHRMRPEISALIAPRIYPNLKNHESVFGRPDVAGVEKPVYFIDHKIPEQACEDASKKNMHEASFLIRLARHLVLNGHHPEDITILAAYLGQMYEMQRERKKYMPLLQDVRIAVLDNYQGEESEIILLSLVRSNDENKIGFLNVVNRVCVALSRARTGLYITGNMEHLIKSNTTDIWPSIKETLEKADMIGPYLTLRCQIHSYNVTQVTCADDFAGIIEGGCKEFCNTVLACGHKCPIRCHVSDKDHKEFKCKEKCNRKLCENDDHACKKLCYEPCGPCYYLVVKKLDCEHTGTMKCSLNPVDYKCLVQKESKLPCGHTVDKPCHIDPDDYKCPHPCDTKVEPCGHACVRKCHIRDDPDHEMYKCRKQCPKYNAGCQEKSDKHRCKKLCYEECLKCKIFVRRVRSCFHARYIPCSSDIEKYKCPKLCGKLLSCGHKCKNKCHEGCGPCGVMIEKSIPECNHKVKIKCSEEPSRKLCNGKCPLKLPCGHKCLERCSDPCTPQCREKIDCDFKSPCGHTITKIDCHLKSDIADGDLRLLQYCTTPCSELLLCEHPCSGTCVECHQGRLHKKCAEKCGALQICSHECTTSCRKACRPCTQQCLYRCKHSKCGRKCGEPCAMCSERCERFCYHQRCSNLCGIICSVPPCEKPCKKRLRCEHPCTGFCSDPCPPLCFKCDKEEIETIFMTFATENERDARLVLLVDCGHTVENSGMNRYLSQDRHEIKMKVCPLCKTPIITTRRYSDYVKECLQDIHQVKQKLYGSADVNLKKRNDLLERIQDLAVKMPKNLKDAMSFYVIKERLEDKVRGRRQTFSAMDLTSLESKYVILKNIQEILAKVRFAGEDIWMKNVRFICKFMLTSVDEIRDQEIADITRELKRLSHLARLIAIIQLCKNEPTPEIETLYNECEKKVSVFRKFTEEANKEVEELIELLEKLLPEHEPITRAEIQQIVSAMGTARGHWYKCPNGHNYYIGECGGAMVQSKCNECGSAIGGESHRLLYNNSHSNIDGSSYSAWSEQANMMNYDLRNVMGDVRNQRQGFRNIRNWRNNRRFR